MRKTGIWGFGAAVALLIGVSSAAAQGVPPAETPSVRQGQPGQTSAPDGTVPPPPEAQPQAPIADQSKPAAVGPAQADSAGSMPAEGPPGATEHTMPSTLSQQNAALDKLPITALQLPLTDAEKQQIAQSLGNAPAGSAGAGIDKVGVSDFLPRNVELQAFPEDLTKLLPQLSRYKYVKADGRTLIIDPPIYAVVKEIKK